MKVKSVSSVSSSSSTKSSGSVGGASGSGFASLLIGNEVSSMAELNTTTGVSSINSITPNQIIQENEEKRNKRKRIINYGNDLLDKLQEIQIGLIKGLIPKEKLFQLSQKLRARNQAEIESDPLLKAIIEDIEIRVEVELAKLTKTSS